MRANYKMILYVEISEELNTMEGLQSDRERAESVCQLICDDVCASGRVATYEILDSELKVK